MIGRGGDRRQNGGMLTGRGSDHLESGRQLRGDLSFVVVVVVQLVARRRRRSGHVLAVFVVAVGGLHVQYAQANGENRFGFQVVDLKKKRRKE